VVLIGASNLSFMHADLAATIGSAVDERVELLVAMGCGRSYGKKTRFFFKNFSGVLESGIWRALSVSGASRTTAILSDIGNDLAYEVPVDEVVSWVREAVIRLQDQGARIALNNLPWPALSEVGSVRFYAMRSLLFPNCRLAHGELLDRAERLFDAVGRLGRELKTPVFVGEKPWYGLDPIHPRRRHSHRIWERMLGSVLWSDRPVRIRRATAAQRRLCHDAARRPSSGAIDPNVSQRTLKCLGSVTRLCHF
jgi:hypothetical protein